VPTLAAEHMAEGDGLAIDAETLRRWMLAEGLWSRARKRKAYLHRRQRRAHFGELIQLDGSFHEWLEKRGPSACLMNMVDDATGTTLARSARRRQPGPRRGFCVRGASGMACHGRCTRTGRTFTKRKPTAKEELEGTVPVSQFGRMCAWLGIEITAANSPQAKGRVERKRTRTVW
jgi:hypothetical protein